ncbi:hypothetical protein BTA51_23165 [Hahella sp. CCB-MM4]|uniref:hypothetical protein n=1 Tax=Hahella sp. (strain CCB-MM4) TaxID=1926491 RepID=UPI000B9B6941|nr:hypothetical protein [Hahella sp. CCB-MM4]OZG71008.1 hypothetical protein BTA51_23165 [Hahella sp. CCB-MM4]
MIRTIKLLSILLLGLAATTHANHPTSHGQEMEHGQSPIPEGVPTPQIELALFDDRSLDNLDDLNNKDTRSGYNLKLNLRNYSLVPPVEEIIATTVTGHLTGHAHLYINGKKIMRIYGHYVHLPSNLLVKGLNVITVSLNNHHHDTWTLNGQEIQATLTINTVLDQSVINAYSSSPLTPPTLIAGESAGNL